MPTTTQLNLSRRDLERLFYACRVAGFYYEEFVIPRLWKRDLETLEDLGYYPAEGEEEAAFMHAMEDISDDCRELGRLNSWLSEEAKKLPEIV